MLGDIGVERATVVGRLGVVLLFFELEVVGRVPHLS